VPSLNEKKVMERERKKGIYVVKTGAKEGKKSNYKTKINNTLDTNKYIIGHRKKQINYLREIKIYRR